MKKLSAFLQFIIGFLLGVSILLGGSAALGYFVFTRLATPPQKPLFGDEKKTTQPVANTETISPSNATVQPAVSEVTSTTRTQATLPPGTYLARVTWPQGLILRAEPSTESARLGGLAYNSKIIVLGTNEDRQWQRIRLEQGQQEGWIKSGNIEKIEE